MRNITCDRCGRKIEEPCIGKYYVGEWSEPQKKTSARVLDLCADCVLALQLWIEVPIESDSVTYSDLFIPGNRTMASTDV